MKTTFLLSFLLSILIAPIHDVTAQAKQQLDAEACCISIIVRDLEQVQEWYSDALKFETVTAFRNEDRGIAITNMQLGATRLELIEVANSVNPDSLSAPSARLEGLFKFGLRTDDLDAWLNHLKSFQPDINGQVVNDPISGKRTVVIRDPEGNRIQFFED